MPPVLTSIAPSSGPPGTAITLTGSGFVNGAQVGCPALVATTFVSSTQLTATIPAGLAGPPGSLSVSVYVQNPDTTISGIVIFTALMPYPESQAAPDNSQSFTTIDVVCGELPGFKRGGRIPDSQIFTWMRSVAGKIMAIFIRRGLSLNPVDWQTAATNPEGTASTTGLTPAAWLEMVNRLGAAARLARMVGGEFVSGKWNLAESLAADYDQEMAALEAGDMDKLFNPQAATVDVGPQFQSGDMTDGQGDATNAFSREGVDGGPPLTGNPSMPGSGGLPGGGGGAGNPPFIA
ncbi:MAG: IPT/TIG domain-containing protein [Patescibacteria group bacterium]|nr:IPT/TIG domain-containing protein [Patescibacteria group bacterium]